MVKVRVQLERAFNSVDHHLEPDCLVDSTLSQGPRLSLHVAYTLPSSGMMHTTWHSSDRRHQLDICPFELVVI